MRAGLFTLLATLLFLAIPGTLITATSSPSMRPGQPAFTSWGSLVVECGLSPPTTLWVLTFRSADLVKDSDPFNATARILAAVAGLQCYLVAIAGLWLLTRARLRNWPLGT
jgi:hypothetical protein